MNSADKIYAQALFDMSKEGNITISSIKTDLLLIDNVFKNSSDLYSVLISPVVAFDKKKIILSDVFSGNIANEILNFLYILTEKGKIINFDSILSAFIELSDFADGVKHVKIYSAIELSDVYKNELTDKLSVKLSKTPMPEWIIDEDIIGGLVIKYDDNVIDMSVKGKLDKFMKGNV